MRYWPFKGCFASLLKYHSSEFYSNLDIFNSREAISEVIIGLLLVFGSRTAIAGAVIGLLLVFYNSKNLNCIGALCFFKDVFDDTFFDDFNHSKRDKQVKPSGH